MLDDADVVDPKLPTRLAREFEAMLPLVRWLNGVLGHERGSAATRAAPSLLART